MSSEPSTDGPAAIFVAGADGLGFDVDRRRAAAAGFEVSPFRVPKYDGHLVDHRRDYFECVARGLAEEVRRLRLRLPGRFVAGVGRNHGGSLLGYAASTGTAFDALAFVGAIPALSQFRLRSQHASARRFRQALEGRDATQALAELADLDLIATLERLSPERCLVQVGRRDEWMDETSLPVFGTLGERHRVEWTDDDHAMEATSSVEQRWRFIEQLLLESR